MSTSSGSREPLGLVLRMRLANRRRAWLGLGVLGAVALALAVAPTLLRAHAERRIRPDVRWRALMPLDFRRIGVGPQGGSVWRGTIRNSFARGSPSLVYLPPKLELGALYPVIYLLHGMPGSPESYVHALRLADVVDRLIGQGELRPAIIVMPAAGANGRYDGEWAGAWERFVVRDVVPWTDDHLPTIHAARGRSIAGLSAGGYGAVDIALRHPGLFGTVEAWSGYFRPLRDGPLADATAAQLAAHDPTLLAEEKARMLRAAHVRFFLSAGRQDRQALDGARSFASELGALGLSTRLLLAPGGHHASFWRKQLEPALTFAAGRAGSAAKR